MARPRVAIGGFQHETNTFVSRPTTYDDFVAADGWPGLTRGAAVFDALAGRNIGMAGLLDGALAQGWEIAPLAWCGGGAGGIVTDDAFERIMAMLLEDLAAAAPLDGVLLDLHGAMASERYDDADGEVLRRVRATLGAKTPIACSLDLHANISPEMTALSDMLALYRTYPHLDMAETGRRAAARMQTLLAGETPAVAFRQIPFLIPTTRGCTMTDPAQSIYALVDRLSREDGMIELGFACGFSPSDVPHCGPSVISYAADQARADAAVNVVAEAVADAEEAFAASLWSVEDAVPHACATARRSGGPIILADVEDNPGAGAPSDATWILAALAREGEGAAGAMIGLLCDPAAVEKARAAGVGATIETPLGGRSGAASGGPYSARYRITALSDGRFRSTGVYFAGAELDLGPMAALRVGGVTVVVSSRREQAADPEMFRHLGLEPRDASVLALKSSVHYRADFQPLAAEIIEVAAPRARSGGSPRHQKLRPGVRASPRSSG